MNLQLLTGTRQSGGVRISQSSRSSSLTDITLGTIASYSDVSDESVRSGANAILVGRRDQSGTRDILPSLTRGYTDTTQGMDQKAERNVHNQLVEVTCGTDAGQYFLITPKLLTGLRYHERMKVLIVGNGTWCKCPNRYALMRMF